MKKNFKHINFEQRKEINRLVTTKAKAKEIGFLLGLDPTSISKELRRNRVYMYPDNRKTNKKCKKLDRFPYVCNGCDLKYKVCPFDKYKYEAKRAQSLADNHLVLNRRGLNISEDEFKALDEFIKEGTIAGKSIYDIVKSNKEIKKSVSTVYRYIDNKYLTTKKIDLPYAVTYKPRKHKKKYDYLDNKNIDRKNHTYLDYLAHVKEFPNRFGWQLDFLGSIKSDTKSILTLVNPSIHFPLLSIIDRPNSSKVVAYFNELEEKIGIEAFKIIFPYILTDRDPSFNDYNGICFSHITGEERTRLFYCDPYVSNQKPSIENLNKQLRRFFPKKESVQKYTNTDINEVNMVLIESKLLSLDGHSPKEAFIRVFGIKVLEDLLK